MTDLRPEDILHKSYLNRLLMEIIDRPILAHNLAFKGGTCASMLGYLDRFSVDLDFDILKKADEKALRQEFHRVFAALDLIISKEFDQILFFQLHYPNDPGKRNTLKVSGSNLFVKANQYKVQNLTDIDRLICFISYPNSVSGILAIIGTMCIQMKQTPIGCLFLSKTHFE